MKMSITVRWLLIAAGILISIGGFFVPGEQYKSIAGVCIGIGAGLAGMQGALLIMQLYYKKHPDLKKQNDIEAKDERTITINSKAKAKAYDVIIRILMLIPFVMIFFDVSLWWILATVALYLLGFALQMIFIARYSKEM